METRNPFEGPVRAVPLAAIGPDGRTAFGLDPVPEALKDSVAAIGITHPVLLAPTWDGFAIACGHRRVTVARALGHTTMPARVAPEPLSDAERLRLNLEENRGHRSWSDIEAGRILDRLRQAGMTDDALVQTGLPLMARERSMKLAQDLLRGAALPESLQWLLHALGCPLRVYGPLASWDAEGLGVLETLLEALRPGVNKCRELIEWTDEAARRDGCSTAAILSAEAIQSPLANPDLSPHDRYGAVHAALHRLRFPSITDLREQVLRALDGLKLDPRIKLRAPENFEGDRLKIEFQFASAEELQRLAEDLFRASDTEALKALLKIFSSMGDV